MYFAQPGHSQLRRDSCLEIAAGSAMAQHDQRGLYARWVPRVVDAENAAMRHILRSIACVAVILTDRDKLKSMVIGKSKTVIPPYLGTAFDAAVAASFGPDPRADPDREKYLVSCKGHLSSMKKFCLYATRNFGGANWGKTTKEEQFFCYTVLVRPFLHTEAASAFMSEAGLIMNEDFVEAFVDFTMGEHGHEWTIKGDVVQFCRTAAQAFDARVDAAVAELENTGAGEAVAALPAPPAPAAAPRDAEDPAPQPASPADRSPSPRSLASDLDPDAWLAENDALPSPPTTPSPDRDAPPPPRPARVATPPPPPPATTTTVEETVPGPSPAPPQEAQELLVNVGEAGPATGLAPVAATATIIPAQPPVTTTLVRDAAPPPTPESTAADDPGTELPPSSATPARGEPAAPEVVVATSSHAVARGPRSPQRVAARPAPPLGNARETTAHVAADAEPSRAAEARHDQVVAKKLEELEQYYLLLEERAESHIAAAREECFERIREVEAAADARVREIEDATDARIRDALRAAAAADREALRASGAADRADERSRAQDRAWASRRPRGGR